MCGIFGFLTRSGDRAVCMNTLRKIAIKTQERGRHAFGLAWIDQSGNLNSFKRPGAVTDDISDIDRCEHALAVIGHCRYATHGDPETNENNHPHKCRNGLFVHNGVVSNYEKLCENYELEMKTECDTEVIGLLIDQKGNLATRTRDAIRVIRGNLAVLGLFPNPNPDMTPGGAAYNARFLIAKRGNPIHFGQSKHDFWFGSFPDHLGGTVSSVKEDSVCVLTVSDSWNHITADRENVYPKSFYPHNGTLFQN
jgi:glucosamine 6-phosphate synthetase-like amidotransferase/phosphosugar isomerase protein